ncbi:MAG: sigma-54-dependent Fis family transcriptional regulator [Alphaproteobacteria bacterium]|nr:sigma-54-dependent Fis family transcriptional regulator [Alphaproteobacteria bacterium]
MIHEILIVDDEPDIRRLIGQILADEGYQTATAANSREVFAFLDKRKPDAVILDVFLQGSDLDGLGILEELRRLYPRLPVIMISGHGTIETAVSALKRGAYDFLEKPFASERLTSLLKRALEVYRLREQNEELRSQLEDGHGIIGQSPWAERTRKDLPKLAKSNSRRAVGRRRWRAPFMQPLQGRRHRLWWSIAPPCAKMNLNVSCLVMRVPTTVTTRAIARGCWNVPRGEPCFCVKLRIYRWNARVRLPAFCKTPVLAPLA